MKLCVADSLHWGQRRHTKGLLLNEEMSACARLDTQFLLCFDKNVLKKHADLNTSYETCYHHYPMMDKVMYFLVFIYTCILPH